MQAQASGKPLSVCLCLSGSMRNFEQNFEWVSDFRRRHKLDIVVSTWEERGGKLFGALGPSRLPGLLPPGTYTALPPPWLSRSFFEYLPALLKSAENRGVRAKINADYIQQILPGSTVHVEQSFRFTWFEGPRLDLVKPKSDDPFTLQMLYKIWQADNLRKNLEYQNGHRYDVVVRARPDRMPQHITDEFLFNIKPGCIWLDAVNNSTGFAGDQFAIGDSFTMTTYSGIFPWALLRAEKDELIQIHKDMYMYLSSRGIEMRFFEGVPQYSPDKLIAVEDFRPALHDAKSRGRQNNLLGFIVTSEDDVRILSESIEIAADFADNNKQVEAGRLCKHIADLSNFFNPERDAGFLLSLLRQEGLGLESRHQMALFLMSLLAFRTHAHVIAASEFFVAFCKLLENAARVERKLLVTSADVSAYAITESLVWPVDLASVSTMVDSGHVRAHAERVLSGVLDHIVQRDPVLWTRVAGHLERHGAYESALEANEKALQAAHRGRADVLVQRARIFARLGQIDAARQLADAAGQFAAANHNETPHLHARIAEVKQQIGLPAEVAEQIRRLLILCDGRADRRGVELSLAMASTMAQGIGEWALAEQAGRLLLAYDPNSSAAHIRVAQALNGMGAHERAADFLRQALKACPDDPGLVVDLARTLARLLRPAEAASMLRDVLTRAPNALVERELQRLVPNLDDAPNLHQS